MPRSSRRVIYPFEVGMPCLVVLSPDGGGNVRWRIGQVKRLRYPRNTPKAEIATRDGFVDLSKVSRRGVYYPHDGNPERHDPTCHATIIMNHNMVRAALADFAPDVTRERRDELTNEIMKEVLSQWPTLSPNMQHPAAYLSMSTLT